MLKWTKNRPCQPGWYWHNQFNGVRFLGPTIEHVSLDESGHLYLDFEGSPVYSLSEISQACEWAGPIQEPLPNDDCNTTHVHVKLKDGEYEIQR
jgi:hypothetical protein